MSRASTSTNTARCVVCDEVETRESPFVAVLTEVRHHHAWMHAGACHERYREEAAVTMRELAKGKVAG